MCVTWLCVCILSCKRPHTTIAACKMPQKTSSCKSKEFVLASHSGHQSTSCFESTISKLCISWEMLKAIIFTLSLWLSVSPQNLYTFYCCTFTLLGVCFFLFFQVAKTAIPHSGTHLPNTVKMGRWHAFSSVCPPCVLFCSLKNHSHWHLIHMC